jgi:transcriptional regulator with XRE-family HTH domain
MDRDWGRLGKALKAARTSEHVKLKQDELAEALGVGRSTIQMIERGEEYSKPTPSIRAYAKLVGWTEESVDQVLAGGEPNYAHAGSATAGKLKEEGQISAEETSLPLRIVDELKGDGALIDSVVLPLGDDGRMVVIVKGRPNATPEQIRRNLEAWRRAERHLQLLETDEDPNDMANGA